MPYSVIDIEVNHNCIVIEGQQVVRPNGISVATWMEYWEEHLRGTFSDGYQRCCIEHDIIE